MHPLYTFYGLINNSLFIFPHFIIISTISVYMLHMYIQQKENRKRETEEQQRRIREREQLQYADKDRSQYQQQHGAQASTTPILEIPPQMIPGPAPYIIASPALAAPSPSQQHPGNNTAVATCSPPENNVPNGSTTSPVGMDQQPMFPNISTTRLRTSVSCDVSDPVI